ncbi:MAG: hypothetical protein ACRD3J_13685 [Thermoanaerobaculia bacterium]
MIAAVGVLAFGAALVGQVSDTVTLPLEQQQYDMSKEGRAFLVQEAANSSLFMLGELHGENEIPSLIRVIWPSMWEAGYRHVAAEISPWSADRLEFGNSNTSSVGLWTQPEATFVASLKGKWGSRGALGLRHRGNSATVGYPGSRSRESSRRASPGGSRPSGQRLPASHCADAPPERPVCHSNKGSRR